MQIIHFVLNSKPFIEREKLDSIKYVTRNKLRNYYKFSQTNIMQTSVNYNNQNYKNNPNIKNQHLPNNQ